MKSTLKYSAVLLAILAASFTLSGQGGKVFVYGPQIFVRSAGKPVAQVETFSVPKGVATPFTICVVNGFPVDQNHDCDWYRGRRDDDPLLQGFDHSKEVTSATVTLNGTTVLTPSDFNPHEIYVVKSVSLKQSGTNTLEVTVDGNPGSFIFLGITGTKGSTTDTTKPQLTITSPTNGAITKNSTITVSGTVTDQSAVTLTVNGTSTSVTNGSFSTSVSLLEGTNVITVVATDASGNKTTQTITVIKDSTPPTLAVTQPTSGLITNNSTLTVSGTVADSTSVTLTVNGNAVSLTNGSFSTTINLSEGLNTVTVVATDAAGNTTTMTKSARLYTIPPTLTVSSPSDGAITNQVSINVAGTVTDSTQVTLTVNGTPVALNSNGSFSYQYSVIEGKNIITILATDAAGNKTTVARTVTRDTVAPVVTISSPSNGYLTNQSSVSISGTVTDSTVATLTINGSPVTVNSGGTFSQVVSLVEGMNTITIIATDVAGNVTTVTRTVKEDSTPPTLTIVSPADSLVTNQMDVNVSGTVFDSTTVTLTVNGTQAVIGTGGIYQSAMALQEGFNIITVIATDAAGNSITVTRTVRLETTSPTLTVTSPQDSLLTNQSTITLNGTVTDSTQVTLRVNGSIVPVTNGTFTTSLTLAEGQNVITVTATNAAGNTITVSRHFTLYTIAPSLTITSIQDSLITNKSQIQISGTVSDSFAVTIQINGSSVPMSNGSFSTTYSLVEGMNTMTIVVTDKAGNSTTVVRTVRKYSVPPTIAVSYPSNGFITNQASVTISGSVQDSTSATLSVNGSPVTVGGDGLFSQQVSLVEGTNVCSISAVDAAGNTSARQITIIKDTTPPFVSLISPADSVVTNNPTISVSGTINDSTTVTIKVNGDSAAVINSNFQASVTAHEGLNVITIVATDAAGNSTTVVRRVILDTISPTLTITYPSDSLTTNQAQVQISGTVADSTKLTLRINGSAVPIVNGAFNTSLTLTEGMNVIAITATDAAGNVTTVDRMVRFYGAGLVLTVSAPVDSLITNQATIQINGTIADSTSATVKINGNTVALTNGSFISNFIPSEGLNQITVVATDAAGNTTAITRTVRLYTVTPVITVQSPQDGSSTYDSTTTIKGALTDSTQVTLTINGNSIPVSSDGSFSTTIPLVIGANQITISVTDAAGNTSSKQLSVIKSNIILPPDPATVAPKLDPTAVITVGEATKFLYTGPNPIQKGVDTSLIDFIRPE